MSYEPFSLTKNEQEIMDLLWVQNRPLSRADIIELSDSRSWKASSIHILLNQLLAKGAIKVDGFVKTGKNYGRTFVATISMEEYQAMQFKNSISYRQSKSSALTNLFSALIQDEVIDGQTLAQLEAILRTKKGDNK